MTGFNPAVRGVRRREHARGPCSPRCPSAARSAASPASVQVLGVNYRYVDGTITSAGYAWSGFTAALLALANPLYTVVGGVFLGRSTWARRAWSAGPSVPLQLVDVVKASIILMIAVRVAIAIGLRRALRVPPAAD